MEHNKQILIVGTYGIDVFHGMHDIDGCTVKTAYTPKSTLEYIKNCSFDVIIINLEPDGKGEVAEAYLIQAIAESHRQENAVCLGVSTQYPHALPAGKRAKHLGILAGWLTLPIDSIDLMSHIVELVESPHPLKVKDKLLKEMNAAALVA